jgi:hypothetical protein
MKRQEVLAREMAVGPLLTSVLLSLESNSEDEGSRKESGDTTTLPGAVIRSAEDATEAQTDQPVMVNLGPMLTLLTMLRRRTSRRDRPRWQGPTLPRGCVMVVRYMSR